MKLYYASDLHVDINHEYRVPIPDDAAESIFIIPGDINTGVCGDMVTELIAEELAYYAQYYLHVIAVLGNHDNYGNNVSNQIAEVSTAIRKFCTKSNVTLLHAGLPYRVIEGITFWGDTLWSGLHLSDTNPLAHFTLRRSIADFSSILIKSGNGPIRLFEPSDMLALNKHALKALKKFLSSGNLHKKVVITHFTPSMQSMDDRFLGSSFNDYFHNNYDHLIEKCDVQYWFHGHTHISKDYMIGETRVLCNPVGYRGYNEHTGFDPERFVVI